MKGRIAAGLTAGALSLFSGGIVGHALTISTTTLTSATNPKYQQSSASYNSYNYNADGTVARKTDANGNTELYTADRRDGLYSE